MKKIGYWLTAAVLIPGLCFAANQTTEKVFHNAENGKLYLHFHKTAADAGTITGKFISQIATKRCQDIINKPQPVRGFYNGNAITLSISFPSCGAVGAYVGNRSHNKMQLLFVDAHQLPHTNGKLWNAKFIDMDIFVSDKPRNSND